MQLELPAWAAKVIYSVATATIIGGGTMVLNSHKDNSKQDIQIEQLEQKVKVIDDLGKKLDDTNRNLAELNGYLRGKSDGELARR